MALVRGGVTLRAVDMVDVPWFRSPQDIERARAEAHSVSDTRIASLQANRVDDGFYSTFVVRRLSKPLTRGALRLGWTPQRDHPALVRGRHRGGSGLRAGRSLGAACSGPCCCRRAS